MFQAVKEKRELLRCGEVYLGSVVHSDPLDGRIWSVKWSSVLYTASAVWQELVWSANPLPHSGGLLQVDRAMEHEFMMLCTQTSSNSNMANPGFQGWLCVELAPRVWMHTDAVFSSMIMHGFSASFN